MRNWYTNTRLASRWRMLSITLCCRRRCFVPQSVSDWTWACGTKRAELHQWRKRKPHDFCIGLRAKVKVHPSRMIICNQISPLYLNQGRSSWTPEKDCEREAQLSNHLRSIKIADDEFRLKGDRGQNTARTSNFHFHYCSSNFHISSLTFYLSNLSFLFSWTLYLHSWNHTVTTLLEGINKVAMIHFWEDQCCSITSLLLQSCSYLP